MSRDLRNQRWYVIARDGDRGASIVSVHLTEDAALRALCREQRRGLFPPAYNVITDHRCTVRDYRRPV